MILSSKKDILSMLLNKLYFWSRFVVILIIPKYCKVLRNRVKLIKNMEGRNKKEGYSEICNSIIGNIYYMRRINNNVGFLNYIKNFFNYFGGGRPRNYGVQGTWKEGKLDELKNFNEDNISFEKTVELEKGEVKHMYYYFKKQNEDGTFNLIYVNFTSKVITSGDKKNKVETWEIVKGKSYVTVEAIEIKAGHSIGGYIKDSSEIGWKPVFSKEETIDKFFEIVRQKGGINVKTSWGGKLFYTIEKLEQLEFFKNENFNEFIGNKVENKD